VAGVPALAGARKLPLATDRRGAFQVAIRWGGHGALVCAFASRALQLCLGMRPIRPPPAALPLGGEEGPSSRNLGPDAPAGVPGIACELIPPSAPQAAGPVLIDQGDSDDPFLGESAAGRRDLGRGGLQAAGPPH